MKKLLSVLGLGMGGVAIALGVANSFRLPSEPQVTMQPAQAQMVSNQQQTKPTVVKIYADWCAACRSLEPVVSSLQQQYAGRANFVVLDVSDRAATQASETKARQLGLSDFFAAHRSQTATIAVINPNNGQVLQQFRKNLDRQVYVSAIESAINQISASR